MREASCTDPDTGQLVLFDENFVPSDEWDAWFWNLPLSPSDEPED